MRLEHRSAITAERQDHARIGPEVRVEHQRPVADFVGLAFDSIDRRFGGSDRPAGGGREEWIAERIACAWRERVDKIEQTGPERWMRIVSRRFSSGLGFVVIQDVSEQRKKENLLRNEQERVKLTEEILDTLPVAVAVKDRNLNYVAVNQEFCRLLGRPQDAIVGRGSWDALTPDLAGRIEQMDWQLLSSGEPSVAEIHFVRPDGKALFIERRARRLGKPGSHFIAISLFEETQGAAGDRDAASPLGPSPQGRAAMVPPPLTPPDPVCNALLLTDRREPGQALKLALRAHGVDLCYIRDVPEFAAFLPAARAAGLTVDLILIDFDFDPMAFNVAAASGLHFRMLPKDAGDSAILAEILGVLPQASARRDEEETAELRLAAAEVFDDASAIEAVDIRLDILAVEDNPINRMVLEQMLGNLELTFHIAGTAAEGLRGFLAADRPVGYDAARYGRGRIRKPPAPHRSVANPGRARAGGYRGGSPPREGSRLRRQPFQAAERRGARQARLRHPVRPYGARVRGAPRSWVATAKC